MKTTVAVMLLLGLVGATGTWLVSAAPDAAGELSSERSAIPVRTQVLESVTAVVRNRQFTGVVVAARRTMLAFERAARLKHVAVDEGQSVMADQVVAVLDQRQLDARRDEVQAGLQQQRAVLAEYIAGPRQELIASTEAELAALAADVELRQANFDRTQDLYGRQATSAQVLDEVRLAWKASVASRDAVAKKLEELKTGTRDEQIAAQRAAVAGLEAKMQQLQHDIDDSQLKAPFAAVVVKRLVDEGAMLNPQQPVLELIDANRLEARIGVPSRLISSLDREHYYVLSTDGLDVTARIRDVIAQVDPATRTQTVVLDIDSSFVNQLADGQLIRLNFEEIQEAQGFRVPLTALASGARGLWTVYVVEAESAESGQHVVRSRAVEVLHSDGDHAVIRGAVYEGEHIVPEGVHRVTPGQVVHPSL